MSNKKSCGYKCLKCGYNVKFREEPPRELRMSLTCPNCYVVLHRMSWGEALGLQKGK